MHNFIRAWTQLPSQEKAATECTTVSRWISNDRQLNIFVAFLEHYNKNLAKVRVGTYKNYDDCVSRFMTSTTFPLEQLNIELKKLGFSPMRVHPFEYVAKCSAHYGLDENNVVVVRLGNSGSYCYYWINTYSFFSNRMKTKRIPIATICELILTYYNMRCHSGTNWSPEETYNNLMKYSSEGCSIYECFASLLNNQNTINAPLKPMHAVFTKWPIDKRIESYVKGSWFDDVLITARADKNPNKVFYVNPPFSEEVTIWAFRGVDTLLNEFPTARVIMCLPAWLDMFDGGNAELWEIIQKWGYKQLVLKESWVRNFNERKHIKFPFVIGYINVPKSEWYKQPKNQ